MKLEYHCNSNIPSMQRVVGNVGLQDGELCMFFGDIIPMNKRSGHPWTMRERSDKPRKLKRRARYIFPLPIQFDMSSVPLEYRARLTGDV